MLKLVIALCFFVFSNSIVSQNKKKINTDSLIRFSTNYLSKPYKYASSGPNAFDCSGFIQFVFSNFGKSLPHSSSMLSEMGDSVSFINCVRGDLIFFTSPNSGTKVGHVGIVLEKDGDNIYFIHASTQKGVIFSSLSDGYYKRRFLNIRRILINY